jgi:hypothetical protein
MKQRFDELEGRSHIVNHQILWDEMKGKNDTYFEDQEQTLRVVL